MDPNKKKQRPSVTISPETIAQLTEAAAITGLPLSALVDVCCKRSLPAVVGFLKSEPKIESPEDPTEQQARPLRLARKNVKPKTSFSDRA